MTHAGQGGSSRGGQRTRRAAVAAGVVAGVVKRRRAVCAATVIAKALAISMDAPAPTRADDSADGGTRHNGVGVDEGGGGGGLEEEGGGRVPRGSDQQWPPEWELDEWLKSDPRQRVSPVLLPRGKLVLDRHQAMLTALYSDGSSAQLEASQPLFTPQGVDPVTGQSLPPLLFGCTGGGGSTRALVIQPPPRQRQPLAADEAASVATTAAANGCRAPAMRQATLLGPGGGGATTPRFANMPRAARTPAQVIRWWVRADEPAGLQKALMHWSAAERNHCSYDVSTDKTTSNRTLYAKRKCMAIAFFHFIDSGNGIAEYEAEFTPLNVSNAVTTNYTRSCKYSSQHQLANFSKLLTKEAMAAMTARVCSRQDVIASLKL